MSTAWRVIDCSQADCSIRSERGAIRIERKDTQPVSIPVRDIAVILIGHSTRLGPSALHRLMMADITVLVCDWRGVPLGGALAWADHGRVAARHRAQAEMSLPRRKNAWARILRAKIQGQAHNLKQQRDAYRNLTALAKGVRSGDPDNCEAQAARIYWNRIFHDRRFRRNPGQQVLDQNSLLDYGYTILRGFGIRAIASAGLSGPIGLFHRGRGNAFNLVDDVIEPFRPAIDFAVANLPERSSLDASETKHVLVAAANQVFTASGSTISTELTDLAQQLGRYAEGNIDRLEVPTWLGPHQQVQDACA